MPDIVTPAFPLDELVGAAARVCKPIIDGVDQETAEAARFVDTTEGGKGSVADADEACIAKAFAVAETARVLNPLERAAMLENVAMRFEAQRAYLAAMLILETGCGINSAMGDVRDAVSLCRAFAGLGRQYFASNLLLEGPTGETNELRLVGRGTFVCLSGVGRPLAAFVGSIAAAFAAGNPVIAKPSPRASLMAAATVRAMLGAGFPADTLALLPGSGTTVGRRLVSDRACHGVAFSGSEETATQVNREIAARETGPIIPIIVGPIAWAAYLLRFANERTVTVNTAAAGGNASLMVDSADDN